MKKINQPIRLSIRTPTLDFEIFDENDNKKNKSIYHSIL